jgi:asparagine synthetase B (glutamine-hydrolysing)
MCRILGVIDRRPNRASRTAIEAMRDSMAHGGPDGFALWANADESVVLAHRQLAIIGQQA